MFGEWKKKGLMLILQILPKEMFVKTCCFCANAEYGGHLTKYWDEFGFPNLDNIWLKWFQGRCLVINPIIKSSLEDKDYFKSYNYEIRLFKAQTKLNLLRLIVL